LILQAWEQAEIEKNSNIKGLCLETSEHLESRRGAGAIAGGKVWKKQMGPPLGASTGVSLYEEGQRRWFQRGHGKKEEIPHLDLSAMINNKLSIKEDARGRRGAAVDQRLKGGRPQSLNRSLRRSVDRGHGCKSPSRTALRASD